MLIYGLRPRENSFHSSAGCFHSFNTNTMHVSKNYYERLQYRMFRIHSVFWGNLPVKREKLIGGVANDHPVSNTKAVRLRSA